MDIRDLKVLVKENINLSFTVKKKIDGFIIIVDSNSGQYVLATQRGGARTFRNLDTVYSFLKKMNAIHFKVQVNND